MIVNPGPPPKFHDDRDNLGLNRAVVSEWFPPEHAKQPPTVVRTLFKPGPIQQVDPDDED